MRTVSTRSTASSTGPATTSCPRWREGGEPYEACLKRAQDLGYAEADPTFDVDGTDSAHKLSILLGLGLGADVGARARSAPKGSSASEPFDIEYARQFGLRIKLLAVAKLLRRRGRGARPAHHDPERRACLAGVDGSMNAVEVQGRMSGSDAVLRRRRGFPAHRERGGRRRAMELARSAAQGVARSSAAARATRAAARSPPLVREVSRPSTTCASRVLDRPGVLAGITGALGEPGISIASLLQPERQRVRGRADRDHDARRQRSVAVAQALGRDRGARRS